MSGFFGFDPNVPSLGAGKFEDLEPELPDDEDIDDVNDETFGAGAVFGGDWEVEHEKLAEELEHFKYGVDGHIEIGESNHGRPRNSSLREDDEYGEDPYHRDLSNNYTSQGDDLEKSLSQLVVDDDDIDDPAIMNLSKNRPIPQAKNATNLDNLFGPSSPPAFLNTEHLVSPGKTNIWGSPVTRESYMEPTPPKEDSGIKNLLSMLQGAPKQHKQQHFQDPSIVMAGKPTPLANARSVDELEMEMIGGGGQKKPGRPMTVEELEREMRSQPIPVPPGGRPTHANQQPIGTPPHGQYIQQTIKARPPLNNHVTSRMSGSPGQHFSSSPHAPGFGHSSVPITIAKRGTPPPPGFHQAKRCTSPLLTSLLMRSPPPQAPSPSQTVVPGGVIHPPTPYPRPKGMSARLLMWPRSASPPPHPAVIAVNRSPNPSPPPASNSAGPAQLNGLQNHYPSSQSSFVSSSQPRRLSTPSPPPLSLATSQSPSGGAPNTPPVLGAAMINAMAPHNTGLGNQKLLTPQPTSSRAHSPLAYHHVGSQSVPTNNKRMRPMLAPLLIPQRTSPVLGMAVPLSAPLVSPGVNLTPLSCSSPALTLPDLSLLNGGGVILSPETKRQVLDALRQRLLSPTTDLGSPADRPGPGSGPGPKDRNMPPFLSNAPVQQRMPFPGGFPNDPLRHRGPHPHQGPPPPRGHPMFNQNRPGFEPRFPNGPRTPGDRFPPPGERFPPPGERFPPPDDRFGPPERHQNGDFHGRHPGDHHMERGRGGFNHMDRGRGFPPRGGGRGGFDGPHDGRMGFDMRGRGPPPHDMRGRGGFEMRGRGRGFHHPGYRWRQNSIGDEDDGDHGDRDEYAHLMTQKERDWIIKIQLMQLHTSNPYLDDYYYTKWQMEKLFRERAAKSDKKGEPKLVLPQLAKLDSRMYKPVQFEGSLGRLTASSVHNPRQIIDVKVKTNTTEEEGRHKEVRRFKQLLINIEKSYDLLLDIDDVEKRALALPEDARPALFKDRAQKIHDLYGRLYLETKDDITLAQLLMVRKGAKLVARTVPFLSRDQAVNVVAVVLQYLPVIIRREQADEDWDQCLCMVKLILRRMILQEIKFNTKVMAQLFQSIARVIASLDLETLVLLTGVFTTGDDAATHLTNTLQSKFGASLLWSVISRGEIIFRTVSPVDLDVSSQNAWSSFVQMVGEAACQTPELAQPFYIFPTVPAYLHRHLGVNMSGSMEQRITSALTPCTPPALDLPTTTTTAQVVQVSS